MRLKLCRALATTFIEQFPNCKDYSQFYTATQRWHSSRYALWKRHGFPKPTNKEITLACDIAALRKGGESRLTCRGNAQSQHTQHSRQSVDKALGLTSDDLPYPTESPTTTRLDDLWEVEDETPVL